MRTALIVLLIFAAGTGLAGPVQSAWADGQSADAPDNRFELEAMYLSRPTLSRSEIDPKAVSAPPSLKPKASPLSPSPSGSGAANPPAAAVATPEIDNSYLKEYNVDWSGWISAEADRWYYTLKTTESALGVVFTTVRPTLVQFTCYADGSIGNVVLRQSCGVPIYDRLQIETLLATMPSRAFPAGTKRTSITLCEGWESHPKLPGESDFQPGSFGKGFPKERVSQWCAGR